MEDEAYASDRSLDIDIAETLGESARRPAGKRTSVLQSLRARVRGDWAADRDQVESGVVRTATMTTPTQAGAPKKFGRRAPPPPVPEAFDGNEYERYNALPPRGLFGRGGGPAQSEADADADANPADAEGGFFGGRHNGSRGRTSHTSRFSVQRLSARLPGQLHLPSSRHSLFRRSLMRDGEYVYAFDNPNVGDEEANETYEKVRVDPNAVETGDGTIKGGIKGVEATRYDAKKESRHVPERIFMALLAVSLLWITSYAVCREIVLYVLEVPPYEEVANRNELAFETANFASESYILCVTSKADECEQASDRDLELELDRLNVIKASNEAKISELGTITTTAELQLNSSLTSLDFLISSSAINLGGFLTNTGETDCGFVEELASGQTAALKALYEVEEFHGQAELAVRSREAQIADRELYDKEYLENKTKQLKEVQETVVNVARDPRAAYDSLLGEMDEMAACGSSSLCESGASVRRVYTDGKGEAEAIFAEQKDGAQAYKDAVQAELDKFGNLIDKCNEDSVQAVLNVLFFEVPEKSESTEPSTLDNLQATTMTYLDESEVFDNEKIAAIFESSKEKLGLQKEEEGARHDELIENSNDDSFFGDYDPPEVPDATKDSVQAFDDSSNAFLGTMGINLQAVTGVANDKKGDDDLLLVNATTNLTTGEVLAEYTDHSEWSFYIYSSEIIEGVTTGMDDLTRLLITLDIVFRVLHTIFIIRQYWSMSSLSTPPGDARVKASVGNGWGPKATPMQKMAAIITNPLVISTLVAGFTGALVYLAWATYSPLYFEYVDSCVKAENYTTIDEGNATGTILYRNAYSVLFQYAAADGDQLAIDRVDELNVGRNVLCSQNSFDDTILYNNQAKMYNDYADRLFQTQGVATSLKTCLNMEAIQRQVEGTEHDQLYNQIIGPEFSADSELYLPDINGIYNCSAVGSCAPIRSTLEDSECPGPSEGLIKFRTFEASCTTENYAHSMLFSSFFIFSAFVCINLGRLFIMRGIVRLAWRHIVTGPYSFIGSCTDRGVIVYPEVVSEDEITMREAIEKAVKLRLKQWERWGLLIFFAGFAVNAPWIYGMLFIAENLTYSA